MRYGLFITRLKRGFSRFISFFVGLHQGKSKGEVMRAKGQTCSGRTGQRESERPTCVVYLPLPALLDISLSFWSLLQQLNVTVGSTLSQLKCFYSPSCLVWHECAPERTVDHTLQEDSGLSNWLFVMCDASEIKCSAGGTLCVSKK